MDKYRDMLRTSKTYSTRENALKKLKKETESWSESVPYVIAVNEDGRFAPVVIGLKYVSLAHHGVTVVA